MALTDKLTAIADAVRGKTGKTEGMTLDQMAAEISGIQTGGGGGSGGVYMAKVTLAGNVNKFDVVHNLGTKDLLFALCFAEDLGGLTPSNNIMATSWLNTDIAVRYGARPTYSGGYQSVWTYDPTNTRAQPAMPSSGSYWCVLKDENTFTFERSGSNAGYMAGLTYTIIIMAKSAFSVTGV